MGDVMTMTRSCYDGGGKTSKGRQRREGEERVRECEEKREEREIMERGRGLSRWLENFATKLIYFFYS